MDPALSVPTVAPEVAPPGTGTVPGGDGRTGVDPSARRSPADRFARRILRLPQDAPRQSIFGTESVFGRSIAISAVRCLVTYVFLPLVAPVFKVSGVVGPLLGLVLGAVSTVAIVLSMRRFFAADHKFRWGYAVVGGGILVLLVVAAVSDIATLLG